MRTQSEVTCWNLCKQKHEFQYVQLRKPIRDAHVLGFGKLIHHLLEGTEPKAAPDLFDLAKANAMVAGYRARYPTPPEFIAKEQTWQKTDRAGNVWGGQFDGLIRRDGRVLLLEYKTTSDDIEMGSRYWRRVGGSLDFQVSMYLWATQGTDMATDTCLYDVLRKPAIRAGKTDTPESFYRRNLEILAKEPEKYYQRGEVVRSQDELEQFEEELIATAAMMDWAKERNFRPRNPASCVHFGRECAYIDVCEKAISIDSDLHFRTAESAHEELGKWAGPEDRRHTAEEKQSNIESGRE